MTDDNSSITTTVPPEDTGMVESTELPADDTTSLSARLNQRLVEKGLMKTKTSPITTRLPYPDFEPLEVEGTPISQMIREERR